MSKKVELSKRRVLGVLVVVGLASAAVGVGTFAAFSDTESTTNNTVETGSLDLTINGTDQEVQLLDASGEVPGATGSNTTTLHNNGTVNGEFNVTLANYTSTENSHLDPEVEAGDTSATGGELHNHIYVTVSVDGNSVNQTLADWDSTPSPSQLSGITLNTGNSKDVTVEYFIPEHTGNTIQSDSVTADFEFTLTST